MIWENWFFFGILIIIGNVVFAVLRPGSNWQYIFFGAAWAGTAILLLESMGYPLSFWPFEF